jgi:type IV fimbrial biogenesis protein FimT
MRTEHFRIKLKQRGAQGHSLVELSIVLCIIMLLLITIPCFDALLIHQEQMLVLDRIQQAIAYAKNEAFSRRKIISLCPSLNKISCSLAPDWSTGFIVFENQEGKKQTETHFILEAFEGARHGHLYFSASGNQLHIHPNGTTTNIGTFIYSPKKRSFIKPSGLVVNWAARTYILNE